MRAKLLLNLALALAVAGLAAYVFLRPAEKAEPGIRLTGLSRDQVTRVAIERRKTAPIRLEKRDGHWRMLAPFESRTDDTQADRIVDLVSATARSKLPREDLARFELDPPQVKVTLNDEAFAFGRVNEVTNEQYLATADAVFLVAPFYGYGIPDDATKLVSRMLLGPDEVPEAFDFGGRRVVRDEKGQWTLQGAPSPQGAAALSQDDFNRWADEWRLTSALAAEPYKGPGGKQRITVRFKNGESAVFQIVESATGFGLVRTGQNLLYRFGAEVGRRLMDPRAVAAK